MLDPKIVLLFIMLAIGYFGVGMVLGMQFEPDSGPRGAAILFFWPLVFVIYFLKAFCLGLVGMKQHWEKAFK